MKYGYKHFTGERFCVANRLAMVAGHALGMKRLPAARLFRRTREGEKADFEHEHEDLGGLYYENETMTVDGEAVPVIHVRDRPISDMVRSAAHEVRHLWQHKNGWDMGDERRIEDDADAFAESFTQELGLTGVVYDFILCTGDPGDIGGYGTAGGIYAYDYKSGRVLHGVGYRPRPIWRTWKTVNFEGFA